MQSRVLHEPSSSLWGHGAGWPYPEGSLFPPKLSSAVSLALLFPFSGNYSPTHLAARPLQGHMSLSLLPQWAGANKGEYSLQAVTISSQSLPQKFRIGTQKYFSVSFQVAGCASYKPGSPKLSLFSVTELDQQEKLREREEERGWGRGKEREREGERENIRQQETEMREHPDDTGISGSSLFWGKDAFLPLGSAGHVLMLVINLFFFA